LTDPGVAFAADLPANQISPIFRNDAARALRHDFTFEVWGIWATAKQPLAS
jgi:hypothetical protein